MISVFAANIIRFLKTSAVTDVLVELVSSLLSTEGERLCIEAVAPEFYCFNFHDSLNVLYVSSIKASAEGSHCALLRDKNTKKKFIIGNYSSGFSGTEEH